MGHLVAQRKYQCALDNLESLVVACIFELGKMNRAGTGELLVTSQKICQRMTVCHRLCCHSMSQPSRAPAILDHSATELHRTHQNTRVPVQHSSHMKT